MIGKPFSMAVLAAGVALLVAAGGGAAQQTSLSAQDRNFITELAEANHSEIQLGHLALQRTTNPQVKAFAQQTITDHTNLQDQLTSFASSRNLTLPTSTTPQQQAMVSQLSALSGPQFDKQYIQTMVQAHKKDVAKVQQMMNSQDPAIQNLARKTLPVLESHLRMAESLASQMGIS